MDGGGGGVVGDDISEQWGGELCTIGVLFV